MLISGVWHVCDGGVLRPVVRAEIQASAGSWVNAPLLVDTGADRTVFSADILQALRLQPLVVEDRRQNYASRAICCGTGCESS
jgi:hypothetical protein